MLYDGHDTHVRVVHLRPNSYGVRPYCGEQGMVVFHYDWRNVGRDTDICPLPARVCAACFAMAQRAGFIPVSEVLG